MSLSCVLAAAPLAAQEHADTHRVLLDTLRVPATRAIVNSARAPMAITRVGRSVIQDARPAMGLEEALAAVPGLSVDNRQNFSVGSRIVMRGLGARAAFGVRGVRVLVDGIPLTMPDGQTNLNNLDLGSAGSIHVLRGPASALFGNAAGGVIVIETEPAPDTRSAELRALIGDQGRGSMTRLVKAQAKVAESVGAFDYIASVSRLRADGYRDHGRARQTVFNARAGLAAGADTRITLVVNAMDAPVAESPGALPIDSASARPNMAWPRNVQARAGESAHQAQVGLRLERATGTARTDVSVYALQRALENPLPFGYIDLERRAGGARAQYERGFGSVAVIGGADAEAQRDDRLEFENVDGRPSGEARRNQQDRVSSVGPFLQARIDAGRFGLVAGARYDVVRFESIDRRDLPDDHSGSRTLHAPSVMLGASIASTHATAFGSMATSFQTPTTTELINAPPVAGQPCCPTGFNTSLEPQRARSVELGARGVAADRVAWEAVAYSMEVNDALVPFQVAGVEGRDFFRNAAKTRHRGLELSVTGTVGAGVSLTGAYAHTDVRFRDDGDTTRYEGNRVPGIAPHRLFASATWSVRGTSIAADVQHNAAQPANDANTVTSQRYTLLDVRVQSTLALASFELAPFVALNNLLDRRYSGSVTVNAAAGRYFEPAPGLSVVAGASIRTGAWRRAQQR